MIICERCGLEVPDVVERINSFGVIFTITNKHYKKSDCINALKIELENTKWKLACAQCKPVLDKLYKRITSKNWKYIIM